jgi:hypothetical protein
MSGPTNPPLMSHRSTPWRSLRVIAMLISIAGGALASEAEIPSLTFILPDDPATQERCRQAASWIERRIHDVVVIPDQPPIAVVAWKDPTLHPDQPRTLAGYLITDTLWAAAAIEPFYPVAARRLKEGLARLGRQTNQLHEVIFQPVGRIEHRPDDPDFVHGHSLGIFRVEGDWSIDVRVFQHRWDPAFDLGHPTLFAEHAVYRSMDDFWKGRPEAGRSRLQNILNHDPGSAPIIRWQSSPGVVVDEVNREEWTQFESRQRPLFRNYTFKAALLYYSMKVLGLTAKFPDQANQIRQRIWSAQRPDGGIAHFVDIQSDGTTLPAQDSTGEASAIAILAEMVRPSHR